MKEVFIIFSKSDYTCEKVKEVYLFETTAKKRVEFLKRSYKGMDFYYQGVEVNQE